MKKNYPRGFYKMVANSCDCSVDYVKMVLYKGFNKYKNNDYSERGTELVKKIRQKAQELEKVITPNK